MEQAEGSSDTKRITAQWGTVWKRTAGVTALGVVVGTVVARRRLRLGLPPSEIAATLTSSPSSSATSPVVAAAIASGMSAGAAGGLFLVTRELLRVDMQWEGMAPSLYAGMFTGAILGVLTGGPYHALLGMTTVGGLGAAGEGGVALYNRWYNKKRNQIFRQRLVERRQSLQRQRAELAEGDQQITQIDSQLEAIAYHLGELREKEESDHERIASLAYFKVPSWFPIQPMTEQQLKEKKEKEALEQELLDRYYAQREREFQQQGGGPLSSGPTENKESDGLQ